MHVHYVYTYITPRSRSGLPSCRPARKALAELEEVPSAEARSDCTRARIITAAVIYMFVGLILFVLIVPVSNTRMLNLVMIVLAVNISESCYAP